MLLLLDHKGDEESHPIAAVGGGGWDDQSIISKTILSIQVHPNQEWKVTDYYSWAQGLAVCWWTRTIYKWLQSGCHV